MSYTTESFAAAAIAAVFLAVGCGGAQPDADAPLKDSGGPPDAATLIDLAEDGRKLLPGLEKRDGGPSQIEYVPSNSGKMAGGGTGVQNIIQFTPARG